MYCNELVAFDQAQILACQVMTRRDSAFQTRPLRVRLQCRPVAAARTRLLRIIKSQHLDKEEYQMIFL